VAAVTSTSPGEETWLRVSGAGVAAAAPTTTARALALFYGSSLATVSADSPASRLSLYTGVGGVFEQPSSTRTRPSSVLAGSACAFRPSPALRDYRSPACVGGGAVAGSALATV
jgi:hypothetical protein